MNVSELYPLHTVVKRGGERIFVESKEPLILTNIKDMSIRMVKKHDLYGEFLAALVERGSDMNAIRDVLGKLELEYE